MDRILVSRPCAALPAAASSARLFSALQRAPRSLGAASMAVGFLLSAAGLSAQTLYWDPNTTTAGFSSTATSGNWGTGAFWTSDATGTTGHATFINGRDVVFTAGVANVANTVTLTTAVVANGLSFQNGRVTFSGSGSPSLTIGAGGVTFTNAASVGGDTSFGSSLGTITLSASQTWANNGQNAYTVAAGVKGADASAVTWTLGNQTAFTNTFSGVIANGASAGTLALIVNNPGAGVHNISGTANTYSGKTTVERGILQIASLRNVGGGASSLGAVTTVSDGTIDLGSGSNTASLIYNGSGASTSDRVINLAGSSGGATISSTSGTAANTLTLTGNLTAASGDKTLTLSGTNTGANTFSGVIGDPDGATILSLVKSGAGQWVLGGANTYTGGTTISAGTLAVGAAGTLGQNVFGNDILISGGNLLLNAATNVGGDQTIIVTGGGIGFSYTPASLPSLIDNTGSTGAVFGINYTGTGGIGSIASIDALFTSSGYWSLGAFTGGTGTFTGSSLTAGNGSTYRLGGGGGSLTVQNNILTGANNLRVGGTGGGTIILPNGNTFTGKTTLTNGTLTVSSVGRVSGGTGSSSLGAPSSVANGTIDIGSTTNAVVFNYAGSGESTDRVVNFTGTTGSVTFSNSGTGNLVFENAATFSATGAKAFVFGTTTDTFGGTLGPIIDNGGVATVTKNGLTNSTWTLSGSNTYTGTTQINGGVLGSSGVLANSPRINLAGGLTNFAVLQGQGTITRQLGAGASRLDWGASGGFAAKGGKLTLDLTNNAGTASGALAWGSGSFIGTGTAPMVFGSSSADNQVELKNSFTLNTNDAFNRVIHVEKGLGGDSALLSGVISQNAVAAANSGIVKDGRGTLILSNANTYGGVTIVRSGELVAGGNALSGVAGAFGLGTGTTAAPTAPSAIQLGEAGTGTGSNPTLLIGGAFTVGRNITVNDNGTGNAYAVGGSTDNNATFSGAITIANGSANNNSFRISQVATTGGNALSITGGIVGAANANTKTVTFDNVGAVNVSTGLIADGAGGGKLGVTKSNTGVATLSGANTYTGVTRISAGVLSTGNLANGGVASGIGQSTNAAASLVLDGGTLRYTGATASTDRNFTVTAAKVGTIDVESAATNLTLSGASAATSGGLTKVGAGTLTLTGANFHSGATSVSAGVLALGATGSFANSSLITVGSGATLEVGSVTGGFTVGAAQTLAGNGTISGATTVAGSLTPGASPGLLTFDSSLTFGPVSSTVFEINGLGVRGTDYDGVNVAGALTYGGSLTFSFGSAVGATSSPLDLFGGSFGTAGGAFTSVAATGSYSGSFAFGSGQWTLSTGSETITFNPASGDLSIAVSAIPEPATAAGLAGLIGLGLAAVRRRRVRR